MSEMQTQVAAPAAPAPMTVSNLADMFRAELDAESEPAAQVEPEPVAADAPADAEEATQEISEESAEVEAAADPETTQEPAPVAASVPSGMSDADKAAFAKLSPELQAWVSKREADTRADYTRKTQEVAEQRKAVESGIAAVKHRLEAYDAILSRFTQPDIAPPDPALRNTDPLAFEEQMAGYLQAKHNSEIAEREQAKVRAEHERITQAQYNAYQQEQAQKLVELAPELAAGDDKGKALRKAVFDYATKAGYSKEQLMSASAIDVVTLSKAQKYDAMLAARASAKPVPKIVPKSAAPGPAKAIGRPTNLAVAIQKVVQTGSRDDLAAAFRAQLESEGR